LTYYHPLSFFGQSANIAASLPYGVGNFSGQLLEQDKSAYRSGLLDFSASLFRQSPSRSGDATLAICEMEAENASERQSQNHRSDGTVRPD
jgi:hypothetical protein